MEDGWERPPRLALSHEELTRLIGAAFPGSEVRETAVLATGLANTNIRFSLWDGDQSYVLRLHTRDAGAAVREREVMRFLSGAGATIPVPALLYVDATPKLGVTPYSIWEFVEGELLQDLFTRLPERELVEIARTSAVVLASLQALRFAKCGAFGENLEIIEEYGSPSDFVPNVIQSALFAGRAGTRLGSDLRDALWRAVQRALPMLRAIDDTYCLVHADYKRSNILLRRDQRGWRMAAVLDWEFACAGPPLIDVGIFLRAGERLPRGFRDAFAEGYRAAGGTLPEDWLPLSRLVDLVSQVLFLNAPEERPRVFAESIEVVKESLRVLAG